MYFTASYFSFRVVLCASGTEANANANSFLLRSRTHFSLLLSMKSPIFGFILWHSKLIICILHQFQEVLFMPVTVEGDANTDGKDSSADDFEAMRLWTRSFSSVWENGCEHHHQQPLLLDIFQHKRNLHH